MSQCKPSLAGFLDYLRNSAKIPPEALPDNDAAIPMAYETARALVNLQILQVAPLLYTQAVYFLGTSNIFNFAQDVPAAPELPVGETNLPYFAAYRARWNLLGFVAGVIDSSGDQGTNQHMVTPDSMKGLTLADLQYLKDPYGRNYLAIAQRAGSLWGES